MDSLTSRSMRQIAFLFTSSHVIYPSYIIIFRSAEDTTWLIRLMCGFLTTASFLSRTLPWIIDAVRRARATNSPKCSLRISPRTPLITWYAHINPIAAASLPRSISQFNLFLLSTLCLRLASCASRLFIPSWHSATWWSRSGLVCQSSVMSFIFTTINRGSDYFGGELIRANTPPNTLPAD
jgi:hypothetical protein